MMMPVAVLTLSASVNARPAMNARLHRVEVAGQHEVHRRLAEQRGSRLRGAGQTPPQVEVESVERQRAGGGHRGHAGNRREPLFQRCAGERLPLVRARAAAFVERGEREDVRSGRSRDRRRESAMKLRSMSPEPIEQHERERDLGDDDALSHVLAGLKPERCARVARSVCARFGRDARSAGKNSEHQRRDQRDAAVNPSTIGSIETSVMRGRFAGAMLKQEIDPELGQAEPETRAGTRRARDSRRASAR